MMRTITVRGVGNVSARPDYITISMTIESIRKDYDEAMRDASERISKLQDVAVRSGYAKEDLKTTSFNVDTRYESVKDRQLCLIHQCHQAQSQVNSIFSLLQEA